RYPEPIPETCCGVQVLLFIVTQHSRDWNRVEVANCLQEVAPRPGGDIEKSYRTPLGVGLLDRCPQRLCQQSSPATDAAPPHGIEIEAVDETAERRQTVRLILVDIIEHDTRVVAVLPAEFDAAAQVAQSLHQPSHRGEPPTAPASWPRQPHVLVARVAVTVGVEERVWRRR